MFEKYKLFVLLIVFGWISAGISNAQQSGSCGENLKWNFDSSTGKLEISGKGNMEEGSMPWSNFKSTIHSLSLEDGITSISQRAFQECRVLKNLNIPNSVTYIGSLAFADCDELESVNIPNALTRIKEGVFASCESLKSVNIPNSVTIIEMTAFAQCIGLKSVVIPNSVTYIGDIAFKDCIGLTSVVISNSVTHIGNLAFRGCTGLTSVTIPGSVITLGVGVFYKCENLSEINIDTGNQYYSSINGVVYNKEKTTLIKCPEGKEGSLIIPNSVNTIENGALSQCVGLLSVTIPNSVTKIEPFAFGGCIGLQEIINHAITPQEDDKIFSNVDKTKCVLRVPENSLAEYRNAEGWKEFERIEGIK